MNPLGAEVAVEFSLPAGAQKVLDALERVKHATEDIDRLGAGIPQMAAQANFVSGKQALIAADVVSRAQELVFAEREKAVRQALRAAFQPQIQQALAGAGLGGQAAFSTQAIRSQPDSLLGIGTAVRAAGGAAMIVGMQRFFSLAVRSSERFKEIQATMKALKAGSAEAMKPFGNAIATIFRPVLSMALATVNAFNRLPDGAKGAIAWAVALGSVAATLGLILKITKELLIVERIRAIWSSIGTIWATASKVLKSILTLEILLLAIEKLRAWVAVATALAKGNFPGGLAAAAILGAVGGAIVAGGIAWAFSNRNTVGPAPSAADRPQRRSSWENVYDQRWSRSFG